MKADAKNNLEAGQKFLAATEEAGREDHGLGPAVPGHHRRQGPEAEGRPTSSSVHYKGTLLDGKNFDSSYDRGQPVVFPLDQVDPGLEEGLQLMPVGSKYKLWIPAQPGLRRQGHAGRPDRPERDAGVRRRTARHRQAAAEVARRRLRRRGHAAVSPRRDDAGCDHAAVQAHQDSACASPSSAPATSASSPAPAWPRSATTWSASTSTRPRSRASTAA